MSLDFELVPVLVEWHDAHVGTASWEDRQDLEDDGPAVVHSCGFLLSTEMGGKENHISMVATWSEDDMVHSVFHIPKQMVQRVTVLARKNELDNIATFLENQGSPVRSI